MAVTPAADFLAGRQVLSPMGIASDSLVPSAGSVPCRPLLQMLTLIVLQAESFTVSRLVREHWNLAPS